MTDHSHSEPETDSRLERWLRDEVGPVYDALKTDPDRGIPAEDVFAEIWERYVRHTAKSN